ncbi:MAG: right-handed parallel beta-helix repeat-containing protein [Actinomycetota bacterium]
MRDNANVVRVLVAIVILAALGVGVVLIASSGVDEAAIPELGPIGACEGVGVRGGGSALVDAMTAHRGSTTFCVAPGTYVAGPEGFLVESADVVHGAGVDKTFLTSEVAQRVIDGRSADDVTIIGVDISGGADDGGKAACDQDHALCGRGLEPGDNWTIRNTRVHHADTSGISSPGHSLIVDNVEIDHNGLQWDGPDNNGISAGIKGGVGGAFIITNSFVHDNNQGIWCDVDCDSLHGGLVVANNRVLDNCSFGIHYEYTYADPSTPASATVAGNVVKGNNWCDLPAKAEIGIVSAENATVRDNIFGVTSANPEPGFGFSAFDRGPGPSTGVASDNSFRGDEIRECEAPFVCE